MFVNFRGHFRLLLQCCYFVT